MTSVDVFFFLSPQSRRPRIWTQRRRHQALAPRKPQKHRQNHPRHLAQGRQRTERQLQREKQKKRRRYVSSTAPCARWPSTPPPSCRLTTAVRRGRKKKTKTAALIFPSHAAFNPPANVNFLGTKHKTMLEARSGDGAIKSFPRVGVKSKLAVPPESSTGLQNKTFHCEICDVHVNSETQLKQVGGSKS